MATHPSARIYALLNLLCHCMEYLQCDPATVGGRPEADRLVERVREELARGVDGRGLEQRFPIASAMRLDRVLGTKGEAFESVGRFFLRDGEWVKAAPESPVGETLYRRTDGVGAVDPAHLLRELVRLDRALTNARTTAQHEQLQIEHAAAWKAAIAFASGVPLPAPSRECTWCSGRGFYGSPGKRCEWCDGSGKVPARPVGVAPCDAVQAWQHEEDPARVISAIQKAQALRDGGASASSVKPYSVPLAHGVTPSGALDCCGSGKQEESCKGCAYFGKPNASPAARGVKEGDRG